MRRLKVFRLSRVALLSRTGFENRNVSVGFQDRERNVFHLLTAATAKSGLQFQIADMLLFHDFLKEAAVADEYLGPAFTMVSSFRLR